ncbi:unnamed protein product [Rotaria magnacalcarata]|uniref:Uncharacterized protein n=1 Tax=Rotaria magnacalcarata TaxID=392030 RepID=A0A819C200_9BILA|nr:unnamed protein product [Rotaria magnacalcarata]CAF3966571.1 unnamed protein product [Rotaria magnacalcarata]
MSATVESSFNDLGTTVDPSSSGTSTSINHEKATTSSNWNGVVTACQCCDDTLINEAQLNIRDDNEWNDEESTTEVNDNIFGDHAIIMIMSTRAYIYLWK